MLSLKYSFKKTKKNSTRTLWHFTTTPIKLLASATCQTEVSTDYFSHVTIKALWLYVLTAVCRKIIKYFLLIKWAEMIGMIKVGLTHSLQWCISTDLKIKFSFQCKMWNLKLCLGVCIFRHSFDHM